MAAGRASGCGSMPSIGYARELQKCLKRVNGRKRRRRTLKMYVWNGFLAWSNVCQQTKFFRDDVGVALGKNVDAGGDSRVGSWLFSGWIYSFLSS